MRGALLGYFCSLVIIDIQLDHKEVSKGHISPAYKTMRQSGNHPNSKSQSWSGPSCQRRFFFFGTTSLSLAAQQRIESTCPSCPSPQGYSELSRALMWTSGGKQFTAACRVLDPRCAGLSELAHHHSKYKHAGSVGLRWGSVPWPLPTKPPWGHYPYITISSHQTEVLT